jgi:hypothetical protein
MSMKHHCRRCGEWHDATLPCHTPAAIHVFAAKKQATIQQAADDLENVALAHYLLGRKRP